MVEKLSKGKLDTPLIHRKGCEHDPRTQVRGRGLRILRSFQPRGAALEDQRSQLARASALDLAASPAKSAWFYPVVALVVFSSTRIQSDFTALGWSAIVLLAMEGGLRVRFGRSFEDRYDRLGERAVWELSALIALQTLTFSLLAAAILWHYGVARESFLTLIFTIGACVSGTSSLAARAAVHRLFLACILLPSLLTVIFVMGMRELPFILVFIFFGLFMLHEGAKAGRTYQQAVENAILLEQQAKQLRRLSVTDDLTGAKNRRFFTLHYEREWRRAHRQQSSLSVLMVDLDSFKGINDTHGHLVGDACLKAVSATLYRNVDRPGDIVARFGGDEFVALPHSVEAWAALLSRADRALYAAKSAGSNCLRADGNDAGGLAQLT